MHRDEAYEQTLLADFLLEAVKSKKPAGRSFLNKIRRRYFFFLCHKSAVCEFSKASDEQWSCRVNHAVQYWKCITHLHALFPLYSKFESAPWANKVRRSQCHKRFENLFNRLNRSSQCMTCSIESLWMSHRTFLVLKCQMYDKARLLINEFWYASTIK